MSEGRARLQGWVRAASAALASVCVGACASLRAEPPRAFGPPEDPPARDGFRAEVRPFLERYCLKCHGPEKSKGDLRLDVFRDRDEALRDRWVWAEVVDRLRYREMPPEKQRQPEAREVEAVIAWLERALAEAPPAPLDPGRPALRRLNRAEYQRTVSDLLSVHVPLTDDFPDDDVGYGFDTIGDVLTISPLHLERYLAAAETASRAAIQVFHPVAKRVEAEAATRLGRGRSARGWASLITNGELRAQHVEVPHAGEYVLRVRAWGQQAGPDPARMGLRIDGRDVAKVAVRAAAPDAAEVYEAKVRLEAGRVDLGAAFLNDYYEPDDPDPKQRDRNLHVDWIELKGPLAPPALPRFHACALAGAPADDPAARAAFVLGPLAARAYRGRVEATEVGRLVALVTAAIADGQTFEEGLRLAIQAILVSPRFLYRVELDGRPDGRIRPVTELELASRLSYFLWSSLPDDELFAAARAGHLREGLEAQVRRMLDDPKANALVEQFAGQWLQLRLLETVAPDPEAFPRFDDALRADMRVESEMFFEAVLREDRSVLDLLTGRFSFVNERLAGHYGIPGIRGERFRRVTLPPQRAGVLTQASVLTITSNPSRTSPVKRGRWILEQLLDDPPPPPPPGVDSLDAQEDLAGLSMREKLERHRRDPKCAPCHVRMDPLGFGLENFDPVGGWRDTTGGFPVDATGRLPGGRSFAGPRELRALLVENPRRFVGAFAKHLLIYALGRGPTRDDELALNRLVRSLAPDWRIHDLIVGLTRLEAFQQRRVEADAEPAGEERR